MNKRESIRCTYSTAPRPESAQTCPMRCWSRPRPPQTAEKGYRTERGTKTNDQHEKKKKNNNIDSVSHMTRVVLVVSIQTVHQDGQNTRLDQVVYGRVAVTRQQLPARWGQQYSTVIEETLTKHWTVITKHHDEYEPLLTWRPERRWAECPGYHWSHSTNIHRDQTPHYTDKHSCSVQAISSRLLGWISWNVHVNES